MALVATTKNQNDVWHGVDEISKTKRYEGAKKFLLVICQVENVKDWDELLGRGIFRECLFE